MLVSLALRRAFTKLDYSASMATSPTIERDPRVRASGFAFARRPLPIAILIIAAVTVVRALGSVDPDVCWQLWIAHQLNFGAQLYRDIIETNPPLWFWLGMPVDRLASATHVGSDHILIIVIACCAALSLWATDRLLGALSAPRRTLLLAYAGLVLVGLPWLQFGQREHIVLITTLPYAALIAARSDERPVFASFALMVGTGAAVGFALKHYFLLVPILLELWLIAQQKRKWRPFRPETIALVTVGAFYAGAFVFWASDYFTRALPLILMAYGATGAQRVIDLFQPSIVTAIVTVTLLVANWRSLRTEETSFPRALIVAAMGFAAAYFIQAKGWTYHAVPFAGCAAIALAASFVIRSKTSPVIAICTPALLLIPFWIAAQQATNAPPTNKDVRQAVEGLSPGDSVGFIGSDPGLGWNVILQDRFQYPSRYSGFWMLRAVVDNQHAARPDLRLTRLGRQVVEETVQDFGCEPPRRIIVARPTEAAAKAGEFDILAFFLRDPRFAQLLGHYRSVQRTSVEVYELASPLSPVRTCVRRAQG
jgi:hypothetical protein